jgi:FKBP-type peptidyl-prolyl cis-trans isomerase
MRNLTKQITLLAVLLASFALVATGCGNSAEESAADRYAAQAEEQAQNRPAIEEPEPLTAEKVEPAANEADLDKKPVVAKGEGAPPTELKVQDLIVGDGPAAANGDTLTVQYVGVLFADGKQFDTSWGKPDPFEFPLGQGGVIAGWDQGLVGMKVGGRRKLIIPSDLAYGAQGSPPTIPPDAALIFTVDLKKIGAGA